MIGLIVICGLSIVAMISEILKFRRFLFPVVVLGIAAALGMNVLEWNDPVHLVYFDNMIAFDKPALAFSNVILVISLLWFTLAHNYFKEGTHLVDHYALVLFALVGALILTAFTNMTTLFLGIEILSIPLYVLAASKKWDSASNEAGFKYLIMGAFASSFLLFGIALIYGATGSFDLAAIQSFIALNKAALPGFFYVGVIFILVAMLFKISVAPFHFWAPDVYEGSPTLITAFMSTIVKIAAVAAFIDLFALTFQDVSLLWVKILSIVIATSLIIANLTAGVQTSVKRMLAYSSISHATFMLMIILANNSYGMSIDALLYYSISYSLASIIAFGILYQVTKNSTNGFDAFNGLYVRNPFLAVSMTIAMLSLAGIPVTSGFFAKYFVLTALFGSSNIGIAILAILAAVVGACFYLRVVVSMFHGDSNQRGPLVIDNSQRIVFGICVFLILALGVLPNTLAELFIF